MKKKEAFTLVEILVVVAIIGILLSAILVFWGLAAQKRAAVGSYKYSMKSVQTAGELCAGSEGTILGGRAGDLICTLGNERYPEINSRCSTTEPYFSANPSSGSSWVVTTYTNPGGPAWNCQGCRLECNSVECIHKETVIGDCDPKT